MILSDEVRATAENLVEVCGKQLIDDLASLSDDVWKDTTKMPQSVLDNFGMLCSAVLVLDHEEILKSTMP